ncbi:MAG: hypothetical protein QXF76_02715 [Candidatus Anstonellales archaeon]
MISAKILAYNGSEWVELDLTEDVKIPINLSIFDILNVTSKTSGYTKTITLPNTDKNSKFFAQAYNINADKLFDTKKGADVLIYRGNDLVFGGRMYLLAINESVGKYTYECVCVGSDKSFFDELSNYSLKDLVPSGTIINFSKQDIENQSWTNPSASPNYPVHFVMMDKGYAYQNENTNLKNLHPCVFVNWLLEKCCEKVGYTLDSSSIVYNTTDLRFKHFKHLMVTGDSSYFDLPQSVVNGNTLKVNNNADATTSSSATLYGGAVNHKLLANTEQIDFGNRWNNATSKIDLNSYSFQISVDMRADIELDITYTSGACAAGSPTSVNISISHFLNIDGSYNIANWNNVTHTFNKISTSGNVVKYRTSFSKILQGVANSQVTAADVYWNVLIGDLSAFGWGSCSISSISAKIKQKPATTIYAYPTGLQGNYSLDLTQILPNMNAAEFFKGIIKTFNLFYKVTPDRKVKLDVYDTFFDSSNILDISKFVDIQNIQQKIVSDYFPRKFYYSFSNDDSYLNNDYKNIYKNELYGDYTEDTGFQSKSDKKEYKSIFNFLVPQMNNYVELTAYKVNNGNKEPIEIKPALLYYNGLSAVTDPRDTLNVTNDNTIGATTSYFITGIRRPIGSTFWVDKDTSAYSFYLDYAAAPDYDLVFGIPKLVYYSIVGMNFTQRNTYFSFFYRWNRQFTDKNSVVVETDVAFPSHYPVQLNRVYYFDRSYWYLLQVKDWNVNHQQLVRCVFLKIIDVPKLNFEFIPIGTSGSTFAGDIPTSPTYRTLQSDKIEANEIAVSSIVSSDRTSGIGLRTKTYTYNSSQINSGVELNLPQTTIGVYYYINNSFNTSITLNLSGNAQPVMNSGERGFIAFPKNSTSSLLIIRGTVTSGDITINLIYI